MAKTKAKTKTFGTAQQISEVKAEIEEMTRMLNSADEGKSNIGYLKHSANYIDPDEVKTTINKRKKLLRSMTPRKLTGKAADKAYKEAKELKEWIKNNVPRETYAMYPRGKDPAGKALDFARKVDEQYWWIKNGSKKITRYNYLMQRLEPGRPPEGFEQYVREKA